MLFEQGYVNEGVTNLDRVTDFDLLIQWSQMLRFCDDITLHTFINPSFSPLKKVKVKTMTKTLAIAKYPINFFTLKVPPELLIMYQHIVLCFGGFFNLF